MSLGVFTLLYDTNYLPGVIVLGISLRRILEIQPRNVSLGVLVDKLKLTPAQLSLIELFFDDIIDVSPIQSQLSEKLNDELGRPELDKTFTKVTLWSLSNYDKILYLDADTLPLIPKRESEGSVLDLLSVDFPKHKIMAAPDSGFPDIFNSGVFVLRPDTEDYQSLYELSQLQNSGVSFDGADQGLLNQYFNTEPDWINNLITQGLVSSFQAEDANWIRIPFLYNVTPSAQYEYLPAYKYFSPRSDATPGDLDLGQKSPRGSEKELNEEVVDSSRDTASKYFSSALKFTSTKSNIKVMHFIGPLKPWKAYSLTGIYAKWWGVWKSYFGEESIQNVLAIGSVTSSSGVTDKVEESKPLIHEQTEQERLLDPLTYADAPEIGVSVDTSWDATKEPPHIGSKGEDAKSASEAFKQKMMEFNNVWDQKEDYSVQPSYNDSKSAIDTQNLPYHHVPAERVFNDHFTTLENKNVKTKTALPPPDLAEPTPTGEESSPKAIDSVPLREASPKFLDEEQPQNIEPAIPRIFPWEYRTDYVPERHFD